MIWIMDASINISMEPFRAFVGDMLPDEQRTTGYAMQSFFIGTGAGFLLAIIWTNLQTKEYSPEELESFEENKFAESGNTLLEKR